MVDGRYGSAGNGRTCSRIWKENMRRCYNIPAFILAGGYSRRFGENKALYSHQGRPLIQYAIDLLSELCQTVTITAKDVAAYKGLAIPVLADAAAQQSPLVGLWTGLNASADDWNLFVACDLPQLTRGVVTRLLEAVLRQPADPLQPAIVPVTPNAGLQPLCACYHKSLLAGIEQSLQREESVQKLLAGVNLHTLEFADERPFRNLNRKEDLHDVAAD